MRIFQRCIIILLSVVAVSCIPWPDKWNSDLDLTIGKCCGHTPESWELRIHGDSATYKLKRMGQEEITHFKPTQAQLDNLARVIKSSHPEGIHMRKHSIVHDKGTSFIRIQFKKHSIELEESASRSVINRRRFSDIYECAEALRPVKSN